MLEITDMHCHVLPGVDDGPADMEESMEVLREVAGQGVRTLIVTPHYHPGRYQVEGSRVLQTLEQVRAKVREENLPLRLLPGQECYFYSGLMKALESGEALTLAGSAYVLVEFSPEVLYPEIQYAVRSFELSPWRMILAHYERYRCLFGRKDRLEELRDQGVLLQLNFDRLLGKDLFRRNPWRAHLLEGLVDYLGSDTHGMKFRPPHMAEAAAWMEKKVSRDLLTRVMEENIRKILNSGKRTEDYA